MNLFVATLVTAAGDKSSLPTILAGTAGVLLMVSSSGWDRRRTDEVVKSLQAYRDGLHGALMKVKTVPTKTASESMVVAGGTPRGPGRRPGRRDTVVVRQIRRTG